jgi:hypothetical protein
VRTDEEMRAALRAVIDDIDAGRLHVPRPAPWRARLAPPLVAAAFGLGLSACATSQPSTGTSSEPSASSPLEPIATATPTVTGEPVAPPNAEYMAPAPTRDPPIGTGSAAGSGGPPVGEGPPIDSLPTPMYAVRPPPSPTHGRLDPSPKPAYGVPSPKPPPNPGPRPLYAVD